MNRTPTEMPIAIGDHPIGETHPVYIIAEIGINHNGDVEICKKLIDVAVDAKCNAVKFQKRTPEICVPENQKDQIRNTPWGQLTYLEYRHKTEFGQVEYEEIDNYCSTKGIDWFASCWDGPSIEFINQFKPVAFKVASAGLTDDELLKKTSSCGKPVVLSTGMSTWDEILHAVDVLVDAPLLIAHSTSAYPCDVSELNLQMIDTLKNQFDCPIGYSGHEVGLQTTVAAAAIGAHFIERHITLDRSMWGSDQAASVEPAGLNRLVRDIRSVEQAMGDGIKKVYPSEHDVRQRLRGG